MTRMTHAQIIATAKERNRVFLASIEPENAYAPPHRADSARPPPDTERDLAAEASRVWHEPVEHVGPSRDRVREGERRLKPRPPEKPKATPPRGKCPRCPHPRAKGRGYCEGCQLQVWREQWAHRKALALAGLAPGKVGRPRVASATAERNTLNKRRARRRQERRDEVTGAWGVPAVIASTFAA